MSRTEVFSDLGAIATRLADALRVRRWSVVAPTMLGSEGDNRENQ